MGVLRRLAGPYGTFRTCSVQGKVITEYDGPDWPEEPLSPASPLPEVRALGFGDLRAGFWAGVDDSLLAPRFGVSFSSVFALGGVLMVGLGAGHVVWVLAIPLGFPLLAPFAAAGLYEVSRRMERGEPLTWDGVLGVVWREPTRPLPWAG